MERRLTAILAADVVAYSRLMAAEEAETYSRLTALRTEVVEPAISEHSGRVVKLMGDGILAEFPSVVDAVTCAIAVQKGMARREASVPESRQIRLRIGVNIGDVIIDDDDIYGDGVNVAARLETLASPGGICVSRAVYDHTRGKVGEGFEPMGMHQVKNLPEPIEVFGVALGASPPAQRPARIRAGSWVPIAGALAAVAIAALLWLLPLLREPVPSARQGPATDPRPTVAVLPFENLSASYDDEYFADGLTDDLITDLSKISGLLVIARNSIFALKGQDIDLREVGRELGARYIVEGSVRRASERVRINVQLIDSQSGNHLWAERFDGNTSDIFELQDAVVRHIVKNLAVTLSPSEGFVAQIP